MTILCKHILGIWSVIGLAWIHRKPSPDARSPGPGPGPKHYMFPDFVTFKFKNTQADHSLCNKVFEERQDASRRLDQSKKTIQHNFVELNLIDVSLIVFIIFINVHEKSIKHQSKLRLNKSRGYRFI